MIWLVFRCDRVFSVTYYRYTCEFIGCWGIHVSLLVVGKVLCYGVVCSRVNNVIGRLTLLCGCVNEVMNKSLYSQRTGSSGVWTVVITFPEGATLPVYVILHTDCMSWLAAT